MGKLIEKLALATGVVTVFAGCDNRNIEKLLSQGDQIIALTEKRAMTVMEKGEPSILLGTYLGGDAVVSFRIPKNGNKGSREEAFDCLLDYNARDTYGYPLPSFSCKYQGAEGSAVIGDTRRADTPDKYPSERQKYLATTKAGERSLGDFRVEISPDPSANKCRVTVPAMSGPDTMYETENPETADHCRKFRTKVQEALVRILQMAKKRFGEYAVKDPKSVERMKDVGDRSDEIMKRLTVVP